MATRSRREKRSRGARRHRLRHHQRLNDVDKFERIVPPGARRDRASFQVTPRSTPATHASVRHRARTIQIELMPGTAAPRSAARAQRRASLRRPARPRRLPRLLDVGRTGRRSTFRWAALGTFDVSDLGGGLGVSMPGTSGPATVADYAEAMATAAEARCCQGRPDHRRTGPRHRTTRCLHDLPGDDRGARQGQPRPRSTTASPTTWNLADPLRFEATDRRSRGEKTLRQPHRKARCGSSDRLIRRVPLQTPTVGDLVARPGRRRLLLTMSNRCRRRSSASRWCSPTAGPARLVVRRDSGLRDDLLAHNITNLPRRASTKTIPTQGILWRSGRSDL